MDTDAIRGCIDDADREWVERHLRLALAEVDSLRETLDEISRLSDVDKRDFGAGELATEVGFLRGRLEIIRIKSK